MKNKISLIFALLLIPYGVFSQKIAIPKFEIGRSEMGHQIKSKQKNGDWEDFRYNSTDSLPRSKGTPFRMKHFYKLFYADLDKRNFTPFILGKNDTIYANAAYFQWLRKVDVSRPFQKTVVGKLKKELKHNTRSAEELFHLLMASGIINTQCHLYAKLTVTHITDEANFIEIGYDGKERICTSECFDVPFAFKLQYNKHSKEIILLP
jgi:hypothetical protein